MPWALFRLTRPHLAPPRSYMGFGETSKKDKKAAADAAAAAAGAAAAEQAEWEDGAKKGNKKKEAAAEKAEAKAARKAEADEQLKQEEAEMTTPREGKKKKDKGSSGKLTRAEIAAKAMAALKEKEKEEKKAKIEIAKSGGNEYIGVLHENDNKSEGIDASGIDAAVAALDVGSGSGGGSSGSAKKVNKKAVFAAFEEQTIGRLKEENPGLKLSQYKEQAFKLWQKSPENPDNMAVELS